MVGSCCKIKKHVIFYIYKLQQLNSWFCTWSASQTLMITVVSGHVGVRERALNPAAVGSNASPQTRQQINCAVTENKHGNSSPELGPHLPFVSHSRSELSQHDRRSNTHRRENRQSSISREVTDGWDDARTHIRDRTVQKTHILWLRTTTHMLSVTGESLEGKLFL